MVFARDPTILSAFSGKDGAVLWSWSSRDGNGIGSPAVGDVDRDGVPDVITTFAAGQDRMNCLVKAISGRNGRELWTRDLGERPISNTNTSIVVEDGKPAVEVLAAGERLRALELTTGKPIGAAIDLDAKAVENSRFADLDGDGRVEALVPYSAKNGPGGYSTLAAFTLPEGKVLWKETIRLRFDQGFGAREGSSEWPGVVDLDGDGKPEVIVPDLFRSVRFATSINPEIRGVRVLDGATGAMRWSSILYVQRESTPHGSLDRFAAVDDLDGDGVRDLLVVGTDSRIERRDIPSGYQETQTDCRVYVDALSGKDGRKLWWSSHPIDDPRGYIAQPLFWNHGATGRPLAAISFGGPRHGFPIDPSAKPKVVVLDTASGRLVHEIDGMREARLADFNGDGLLDLWGVIDNRAYAFRGDAPEVWGALGDWRSVADLDGDGLGDLIRCASDPEAAPGNERSAQILSARSGRDGSVLWRTRLNRMSQSSLSKDWPGPFLARTLCDLDGDGKADVLLTKTRGQVSGVDFRSNEIALPLDAFSGKDGHKLWSAGSTAVKLPNGFNQANAGYTGPLGFDVRDVDGDGRQEILALHTHVFTRIQGNQNDSRMKTLLSCFSSKDGRVLWESSLNIRNELSIFWEGGGENSPGDAFKHVFADLDGDGKDELIVVLIAPNKPGQGFATEIRAVSLRDGSTLWVRPLRQRGTVYAPFIAGDLDGDGKAEVVFLDRVYDKQTDMNLSKPVEVVVLAGVDGSTRWFLAGRGSFQQT